MDERIKQLRLRIDRDWARIRQFQTECLHPNVKKTHKADTGNYDPSNDRYWTEYECPDCDKRWDVDTK